MSFQHLLASTNISASGLSAERQRMEIVANNIANAYTTRTAEGGPYRRQQAVFEAVLGQHLAASRRGGMRVSASEMGGVQVAEIINDLSELPMVFNPGHPDADPMGFVMMPNVQVPIEMVDLITANRAYEANLKVLQAFRQQADQTLLLLRG